MKSSILMLLAAALMLCGVGPGYSSGFGDKEKDVGASCFVDGGVDYSFEVSDVAFEVGVPALGDVYVSHEYCLTPTAWGAFLPGAGSGGSFLWAGATIFTETDPSLGYTGLPVLAWRCS